MDAQKIKYILALSVVLNAVLLPLNLLIAKSPYLRWILYERLAERFGTPGIIFAGDSITAFGYIWGPKIGQWNFGVRNIAQPRFTAGQVASAVRQGSIRGARLCFVMAGINDIIQENEMTGFNEATKQHYREIIEVLRANGTEPVITLTLYRQNEPRPDLIDDLNEFLLVLAEEKTLTVISLQEELCKNRSLLPEYTEDGLHLNKKAYKKWAGKIRQVLAEKGSANRNE